MSRRGCVMGEVGLPRKFAAKNRRRVFVWRGISGATLLLGEKVPGDFQPPVREPQQLRHNTSTEYIRRYEVILRNNIVCMELGKNAEDFKAEPL